MSEENNKSPFYGKGTITKEQLSRKYCISKRHLSYLLNEKYYDQLMPLGYEKKSIILSPKIVNKFIEIYGQPF